MAWQGKALGAAVGSALGPLGAAVGAWLGHQLDSSIEDQGRIAAQDEFQCRYCVFALGVCAAYANGTLHPNEQKRLLAFGREIFGQLPPGQIEGFIEEIRRQPPTVAQCAEIFRGVADEFKPVIIREIVSILYADSKLEESEETWVNQLIAISGSHFALWQEVSIYFERGTGLEAERNRCFELLGLPGEASAEAIKKAYRDQAGSYHPDKLANVPEPVRRLAEEKLKDLNLAYEALTRKKSAAADLSGLLALRSPGQWLQGDQLPAGDAVLCPLCGQRNRLPKQESMLIARCGICYALLLLPRWFVAPRQPP
jgi:uncharacterized tellurite resistance protein B-like protein